MARKKAKKSIKVKAPLVGKAGHQKHISGTGTHQDKRKKRLRTRAAKKKQALRDQEDQKVAVVDTEELEEAWMLTNTIESLWTENARVIAVRRELRSTSVGDVMVTAKDGKIFHVAGIGFTEREDWVAQAIHESLDDVDQVRFSVEDIAEVKRRGITLKDLDDERGALLNE